MASFYEGRARNFWRHKLPIYALLINIIKIKDTKIIKKKSYLVSINIIEVRFTNHCSKTIVENSGSTQQLFELIIVRKITLYVVVLKFLFCKLHFPFLMNT